MRYSIRAVYDEKYGLRYQEGRRSVPRYYRSQAESIVKKFLTVAQMKKLLDAHDAEQISVAIAEWEIEKEDNRYSECEVDVFDAPRNVTVERAKPKPRDPEDVPEDAPIRTKNPNEMMEKNPRNNRPPNWFTSEENTTACSCDSKYHYRKKGVGAYGYSDSFTTYVLFECNNCLRTWRREVYRE
jgi:hypothetical protein